MSAASLSRTIQKSDTSFAFGVWIFVSFIALAIIIAIVGAPLALAKGHSTLAGDIYKGFSFFCHQLPDRSFHLAGNKFAVCSRCTGLYVGFAFATLGYPLFRSLKRTDTPRVIWLLLSAVPLVVDFSLTYFGFWQNTHLTRFTTGALFGSIAAIFIVPGLIELSSVLTHRLGASAQLE